MAVARKSWAYTGWDKTSSTTIDFSATPQAEYPATGDLLVGIVAFDNASSTTPTMTGATIYYGNGAIGTPTIVNANSAQSSANGAAKMALWFARVTSNFDSTALGRVTLSAAATARCNVVVCYSGVADPTSYGITPITTGSPNVNDGNAYGMTSSNGRWVVGGAVSETNAAINYGGLNYGTAVTTFTTGSGGASNVSAAVDDCWWGSAAGYVSFYSISDGGWSYLVLDPSSTGNATLTTTTGNATAAGESGAITGQRNPTFSTTTGNATAAGGTGAITGQVNATLTTTTGNAAAAGVSGAITGGATLTTTTGDASAGGGTGALTGTISATLTTTTGDATAGAQSGSLTGGATFSATTVGDAAAAGGTGAITASSSQNATLTTTTGDASAAGESGSITGQRNPTFSTTTGDAAAAGGTGALYPTSNSIATTTGDAAAAGGTGALTGTISATLTTTTGDATAGGGQGLLVGDATYPGSIGDGMSEPESHAHNPALIDTNGNLYRVLETIVADGNHPAMFKSTNNGKTWVEVDSANRPSAQDLEGLWIIQGATGTLNIIVTRDDTVWFCPFNTSDGTNPDTWGTQETVDTGLSSSGMEQYASITRNSDGTFWCFYSDTLSGSSNQIAYRKRTGTNTYGTKQTGTISINADNWTGPASVMGEGDVTHVVYCDDTTHIIYKRTLTDTGTLGSAVQIATGTNTCNLPHAAPIYFDDGGVEVIGVAWIDSSDQLQFNTFRDGTLQTVAQVSSSTVQHDVAAVTNGGVVASLAVDGTTVYAAWADLTSGDILYRVRTGGSWGDIETLWSSGSNEAYYVYIDVHEYDGHKWLGCAFDMGAHANDVGHLRYTAVDLGATSTDATLTTTTGNSSASGGSGTLSGGASLTSTTGDASATGGTGAHTGGASLTTTGGDATAAGGSGALTSDVSLSSTTGDAAAAGGTGALTASVTMTTTTGDAMASGGTQAWTAAATFTTTTGDATAGGGQGAITSPDGRISTTTGDAVAAGSIGQMTGSGSVTLTTTTGDATAGGGSGTLSGDATLTSTTGNASAGGGEGALTGTISATLTTTTGDATAAGGQGALTGQRNVTFETTTGDATAGGGTGALTAEGQPGTLTTTTGDAVASGRLGTFWVITQEAAETSANGTSTTGACWTAPSNAQGAPNDTYATWYSATNHEQSCDLVIAGFGTWAAIPAGATINTVTATIQHHESTVTNPLDYVSVQAYLGASPLGTATQVTLSLTDRDDSINPSLTLAQLQGDTLALHVIGDRGQ